jgi:hypothetical protein
MATILRNFSPDRSFWDANPMVETVPEFKALKKKEGVKKSSAIMWAISFLLDKSEDNVWRNVSQNEAMALIASDFLDDENFDFNKYKEAMSAFRRHLMSPGQRSLLNWETKLEERDEFLKETGYDVSTAKLLDDLQKNTLSLFKVKSQIEEMISKEGDQATIIGKKQESLSEKGQI